MDTANRWPSSPRLQPPTASGVGDIVGGTGFFGHIAYGKGIARYINDLSGFGYDLVPSATDGKLEAMVQYSF